MSDFDNYVDDLKAIRDDAKSSLDSAQGAVENIARGFLRDFTGNKAVYQDFVSGEAPVFDPTQPDPVGNPSGPPDAAPAPTQPDPAEPPEAPPLAEVDLAPPDEVKMPSPLPDLNIPAFNDSWLNSFDPYEVLETSRYDSQFLEDLEQNCRSVFAGAIPGFTNASVDALFQWRGEQDQRDLQVELDEAAVQFGARRGFPIPPDAQAYKQNEIFRRYSYTQADRTRETTTVLANALIDAYKDSMDSGIRIEQIRAQSVTAILDALVARIRAQVEVYKATVDGLVAEYRGEIELIEAEIEVAKTNGVLENQYNQLIAEVAKINGQLQTQYNSNLVDVARINGDLQTQHNSNLIQVAQTNGQLQTQYNELLAEIAKTNGQLQTQFNDTKVRSSDAVIRYYDGLIRKTLGLRDLQLRMISREYEEVNVQNSLITNSAGVLMKAWADIYGSAALGVQTSANEEFTGTP